MFPTDLIKSDVHGSVDIEWSVINNSRYVLHFKRVVIKVFKSIYSKLLHTKNDSKWYSVNC